MGPAAAAADRPGQTDLSKLIEDGVKRGVANALAEHKRAGRSVVVMKDGAIVELPPGEIPVDENAAKGKQHRLKVL